MVDYLSTEQFIQLQARTQVLRDWLLITVQYETGCTVSELVAIKRENVLRRDIRIDERTCRVSEDLLEKLSRYLTTHDSPYVFPSRQQPQLTTKRVQQIIKSCLVQIDADIEKMTPHVLRYTHIAHAVRKGIPISAIMAQTGLGELRLTQIITEVLPADTDEYERMFT